MSKANEITKGGFTPARRVNNHDCEVFRRAFLNGPIGAVYTPLTVMTQLVAGEIYVFGAQEDIISEGNSSHSLVVVTIFEELPCNGGGIYIKSITGGIHDPFINDSEYKELLMDLSIESKREMPGGYTEPRELSEYDKEVFKRAIAQGPIGVTYTACEVSTQVVAGTNYRFRCEAQANYPEAEKYEVYMYVFEALPCYGGKVEITSIKTI